MKSYEVDGTVSLSATIPDIRYNEMTYDSFKVREVSVNGEVTGEYHVSFNTLNDVSVIDIVKDTVSKDAEVLDAENYLNLEYGTYFKVSPGSIEFLTILDLLIELDNKIKERFKK